MEVASSSNNSAVREDLEDLLPPHRVPVVVPVEAPAVPVVVPVVPAVVPAVPVEAPAVPAETGSKANNPDLPSLLRADTVAMLP